MSFKLQSTDSRLRRTVKSIQCINFMCFVNFNATLGPHINFIQCVIQRSAVSCEGADAGGGLRPCAAATPNIRPPLRLQGLWDTLYPWADNGLNCGIRPPERWLTRRRRSGVNGSGKSALLVALQLGLGSSAKDTGRAKDYRDFLRDPAKPARVTVVLSNVGMDAMPGYGPEIVVHRTLEPTATGSRTTVKLENGAGEPIKGGLEKLKDIEDHFNVQLANPCMILTQDMSKKYLHKSSEEKKYQFWIKATQMDEVSANLTRTDGFIKTVQQQVKRKRKSLKPKETLQRKLENRNREFEELNNIQEKVQEVAWQLTWARVAEDELELEVAEQELSKKRAQAEELRAAAASEQDTVGGIEATIAATQAEMEGAIDAFKASKTAASEASAVSRKGDAELRQQKIKLRGEGKAVDEQQRKIDQLQGEYDAAVAAAEAGNEGRMAALKATAEAARQELHLANTRTTEKALKLQETRQAHAAAEEAVREAKKTVEAAEDERREANRKLQDLKKQSGSEAAILKFASDWMPRALQEVQQRRQEFDWMPVGPAGVHMSMDKNSIWTAVAEHALTDGFLRCFAVGSAKDASLLRTIFRKHNRSGHYMPSLQLVNFRDVQPHASQDFRGSRLNASVPRGTRYLIDELDFDLETQEGVLMFNLTVDMKQAEKQMLIEDDRTAETFMLSEQVKRANKMVKAYTAAGVVFTMKGGIFGKQSRTLKDMKRLVKGSKDIKEFWKKSAREAAVASAAAKETLAAKERAHANLKEAFTRAMREHMQAQKYGRVVATRAEEADEALKEEQSRDADEEVVVRQQLLTENTDEKRDLEQVVRISKGELEIMEAKYGELALAKENAEAQLNQGKQQLEDFRNALKGLQDQKDMLQKSKATSAKLLRALEAAIIELDGVPRNGAEGAAAEAEGAAPGELPQSQPPPSPDGAVGKLRRELAATTAQAMEDSEYHGGRRYRPVEGETVLSIHTELTVMKKRMEREREEHNAQDYDTVRRQLKTVCDELASERSQLEKMSRLLESLSSSYHKRLLNFRNYRDSIADESSDFFNEALGERRMAGSLEFNHEERTLRLRVIKNTDAAGAGGEAVAMSDGDDDEDYSGSDADDEQLAGRAGNISGLSGGERSAVTLCFMMSLWRNMETSFRVLDEFDVFLDNVNRKIILNDLMEYASGDAAKRNKVARHAESQADVGGTQLLAGEDTTMPQFMFLSPLSVQDLDLTDVRVNVVRMPLPVRIGGAVPP